MSLDQIEEVIRRGPFTDTWESLSAYEPPEWYQGLKFGIFIHWGVYSVPAYANEWYPRNMYTPGTREFEHHVKTWGPHKTFGYKDFIPLFTAEKFDPAAWADLFKKAGAQYVIPVGEHHDGFQMYGSALSHWNALEMGPKRDVVPEVLGACRDKGLVGGVSSHRIEHWFFLGHGKDFDSDIREPLKKGDLYWPSMADPADLMDFEAENGPSEEFLDDWLERTCEMIDRMKPRILYFDWWIGHKKAAGHVRKMAAYYYNRAAAWGSGGVINFKHGAFPAGAAVPDVERGQLADKKPYLWQSDTSTALNSWCYTEENVFRTPGSLIRDLIDIVSKNGRLLLNAGPRADGTFCEEDVKILCAIGDWLKVNGEAVYPARPFRVFGEGPTNVEEGFFTEGKEKAWGPRDFRFTCVPGAVYIFAMGAPADGQYRIDSLGENRGLAGRIKRVTRLGSAGETAWRRDGDALWIFDGDTSDLPAVFRADLDE